MANAQWIYSGGTNSVEWKCRVIVDQFDQSIANNTSQIRVTFQYTRARSSSYGSNGATTAYITIDGTQYSISVPAYNYGSIGVDDWKTIATKTVTVNHDSAGWRSINISCSWSQGVQPTSCSASGTPVLTVIPRASGVTCNDGNIGSSTTINISRANSSFTHKLEWWYDYVTKGGDIYDGPNTSVGWTIPTTIYSKIPNEKFREIIIYCYTYNNGYQLGYTSCRCKVFVVNSEPTVSASVIDANSATVSLTGSNQKLIKGVSNAKITTTATGKNSATISSIEVSCGDGKSGTGSNLTLNGVTDSNFTIKVTDSRGFSTTLKKALTLVDYTFPAITELSIGRLETSAPLTKITVKGNIFSGNFGSVTNARKLSYWWREAGTTSWGNEIILNPTTVSGSVFNYEANLEQGFDINKDYDICVRIQDKLKIFDKYTRIGKSNPLAIMYKEKVNINGGLEVLGNPIIERVANGFNNYIKYADGTLEYNAIVSGTYAFNQPHGALFYCGTKLTHTWAIQFVEAPIVSVQGFSPSGQSEWCTVDSLSTSGITGYLYNGANTTIWVAWHIKASGRWY